MTNDRSRYQSSDPDELPIVERVVKISRVAKVVKGGRHLSFNALVVVGDMAGHVGVGMGKADAVPDAVRKGAAAARKNMVNIPLKGNSIPHEVISKYVGSVVMLKPAGEGTGVIAGGSVRAVVELAGVKDILTKVRRSTNPVNVVKAAFYGLQMLKDPEEEFEKRKQLTEFSKVRAQERAERAERNRQRQNRNRPPPAPPAAEPQTPPPAAPAAPAQ